MKFIKVPGKCKYFSKGKQTIYNILKDGDKYFLYSGEYNCYLYNSCSLKSVKMIARTIEEDFINNSKEEIGEICAETI